MKKYIITALLIILGGYKASAQSNLTMMAANLPQAMELNPALAPAKDYMTIPLLGSFNIGLRSGLSYNELIINRDGVKYIDGAALSKALTGSGNVTGMSLKLDLLRGGFHISPKDFIDLNLTTRIHVASSMPGEMFDFLLDNPICDVNRTFNISATPNMIGWNEVGIGYARTIGDNFRVGLKVKYLMGMVSMQSDGMNFTMQKNINGYKLSGDFSMSGGNYNFKGGDAIDMVNGLLDNPGVSADLGVEYTSTDRHLTVMASVSDLGAIFWNANNSSQIRAKYPNKVFDFTGFGDLQGLINGNASFPDMVDSVFTSFSNTIGVDTLSGQGFTTMIPTRYHAMAEYAIDRNFRHNVSLSFLGTQPYHGGFDYSISAGYTYRPRSGRWQLMANYTYQPKIPVAIGIAAAYTGRGFQLFMAFDNILPFIDLKSAKSTGFQLGLNILF